MIISIFGLLNADIIKRKKAKVFLKSYLKQFQLKITILRSYNILM